MLKMHLSRRYGLVLKQFRVMFYKRFFFAKMMAGNYLGDFAGFQYFPNSCLSIWSFSLPFYIPRGGGSVARDLQPAASTGCGAQFFVACLTKFQEFLSNDFQGFQKCIYFKLLVKQVYTRIVPACFFHTFNGSHQLR